MCVFHSENLPSDKFLNQHMDLDKFIPLELFLDFGRIKPICNSIDLLTKAVESESLLCACGHLEARLGG